MGVSVYPHENFEGLVEALAGCKRPASLLPQPVVIPSVTFADHLQRALADRCGIAMGFDFLTPQDFIHAAVGPGRDSPWSKHRLMWRVMPHVRGVLGRLGLDDSPVRDRFALAGVLADRLDQYGHFRPEMIRAWQAGRNKTTRKDEDWQRGLWAEVRDAIGLPHPAVAMEALRNDPPARGRLAARFPRLLVLGTGSVDPLLVEVLEILGASGTNVEAHVVLPSLGYLGDLRARRAVPSADCDPESFETPSTHPLLESMGRHSIGTFLLLGKLDEQYTHWPEPAETASSGSLLARLQSDIRALRQPGSGGRGDASIGVHACFGPRREIEVLRDELLRAFDEIPDLKPHEISIVSPDPATYAALIPAILGQGARPLPVRLGEQCLPLEDPLAAGLLALLEIARVGELTASSVMDLLRSPAVLGGLGTDDSEIPRRWIRDSGLMHGMGTDLPGAAGFARERLVAGRFFGSDDDSCYPDGAFVLPVADEVAANSELLSTFLGWFAQLERSVTEWQSPCTAEEWAQRFQKACEGLLGGLDNEDGEAARRAMIFLAETACTEPLDAGAMLDWLTAECADPVRRARAGGQILFGRLKQLQNLPCRVLAIVGMQDASFPARNRPPAWDLLRAEPRAWDRNPRLDDRQLFLDALLTPTERLIITASTRNPRTKESEPFSACVDELLRVLRRMGAAEVVVKQRLQPFDAAYFLPTNELPRSYDEEAAAIASRMLATERPSLPFVTEEPQVTSPQEKVEVSIQDLIGFWRDPATAFLRQMGIRIAREETADDDLDRPPLALAQLLAWKAWRALFDELLLDEPHTEALRARLAANRDLPPGRLGESAWQESLEAIGPVAAAVKDIKCPTGRRVVFENEACVVTGDIPVTRDGSSWLDHVAGARTSPKHYLPAWIRAVVAAAAGEGRPTLLFDESAKPTVCPEIDSASARECLEDLVFGFCARSESPICYLPTVSHSIARAQAAKGASASSVLESAQKAWGDLTSEEAALVWRDRDPFAQMAAWEDWARRIAVPLKTWGEFS